MFVPARSFLPSWVRPGVYSRMEHLKGVSLGWAQCLQRDRLVVPFHLGRLNVCREIGKQGRGQRSQNFLQL
jgi:hypothetical protein